MEEKKITKEEFNEAVMRVIKKQSEDPKLKEVDGGIGLLLMGLAGVTFAADLCRELFGGSEE